MDSSEEILDVVDMADLVTGQATRREIHEKTLIHRAVHILVFNSKGELYIQRRVRTKDENPGLWDSSAAGHVGGGESYDLCAHRELGEELGIQGNLKTAGKLAASLKTSWEHVVIYTCVTDQHLLPDPSEILEGKFRSLHQINSDLKSFSDQFTPTFKEIMNTIVNEKKTFI